MLVAKESLTNTDVKHISSGDSNPSSHEKNEIHWYRMKAIFTCKNSSNCRKSLPIPVINSFVKNVSQKTSCQKLSSLSFYDEVEMPLFHVKSNEFSSESNPDALIQVDFYFFKQNKEDIFFWRQCLIDYIVTDRRFGSNLEIICVTSPQKKIWARKSE